MAAGEYVSMASQRAMYQREISLEAQELQEKPGEAPAHPEDRINRSQRVTFSAKSESMDSAQPGHGGQHALRGAPGAAHLEGGK
jgi:hypothetical protein